MIDPDLPLWANRVLEHMQREITNSEFEVYTDILVMQSYLVASGPDHFKTSEKLAGLIAKAMASLASWYQAAEDDDPYTLIAFESARIIRGIERGDTSSNPIEFAKFAKTILGYLHILMPADPRVLIEAIRHPEKL